MTAAPQADWDPTAVPSLQEGIDKAGSPVALLWKPNAEPWMPEVIEPEYAGWRAEQSAWHQTVAIMDLSHHMSDTFLEGPDATRLLAEVSANNYESFAVGQAKQFVPVAADGNIITDGILLRTGLESYTLSGVEAAQNWVRYHGETGGYDVAIETDPQSSFRFGGEPRIFRYQIQGPLAAELIERVLGEPMPPTKFFHSSIVQIAGRPVRALRHGMAGQAGCEFIGDWAHASAVKDALLTAGAPLGLTHVGAMAYPTSGIESGWIPAPTPALFTDPTLADYRRWLKVFSYEGQNPLRGSYFSEDVRDYYLSPYELGYGRSISFNHDFIGRDALMAARDNVTRTKVTLVFDREDVGRAGADPDRFILDYARYRVEVGSETIGMTHYLATIFPVDAILGLAVVDKKYAVPGTRVTVAWGEHPGPGTDPAFDPGYTVVGATIEAAPYDPHARTAYRANS